MLPVIRYLFLIFEWFKTIQVLFIQVLFYHRHNPENKHFITHLNTSAGADPC